MTSPAQEWVDPDRFAQWIGCGVPVELVTRMLANQRLKSRCGDFIRGRLGSASPSAIQAAALLLDDANLTALTHRIGAVWYAERITGLIDGSAVRDLIAKVGAELRLFAIRN